MVEGNQQAEKLVGVEVSAAELKAVSIDAQGIIQKKTARRFTPGVPLAQQIIEFVEFLKTDFGSFDRLGVAVTGLFDHRTNRVQQSTHLPEQAEVDLIGVITAETGVEVILENDANAAAFGEFYLGAGRGAKNMFYVTLGEGVGGAFIINGEIWRGAAGFAGEFGHTTINSEGMKLEEVASAKNVIRRIRSRYLQDPTSVIGKVIDSEDGITIKEVLEAAAMGDDFARMMLGRTGAYVGIGIANIINLLNIERIVIGGTIMEVKDIVLDAIKLRARELSFTPSYNSTQIVRGELDGLAAAIGVALYAAEHSQRQNFN